MPDNVNTLAAKFQVSTDKIQEWMYQAKIADTEVETIGGSHAKLVKAMDKAQKGTEDQVKAFKALKVEYEDTNGKLRNIDDVFNDAIKSLGNMTDETQADIYANALFGRSFQDLNPLISYGADNLDNLNKKAQEMGLVLSPEKLNKLNKVQDMLDTLGSQFKLAAEPIVEALVPALTKLGDAISGKLADPKVKEALTKHRE